MLFDESGASLHVTLYDAVPEKPYPQLVMHKQCPWSLRDTFIMLTRFSSHQQCLALCRDFLPRLHLMVSSNWQMERDGLPALFEDWTILEQSLKHWVDHAEENSADFFVFLNHGHVIASRHPYTSNINLALEIVREY